MGRITQASMVRPGRIGRRVGVGILAAALIVAGVTAAAPRAEAEVRTVATAAVAAHCVSEKVPAAAP
ncbi:hypothetical protein [Cryobacterium sp. GrIS_2_6]|uniref:hypothetical protein n=1 Tax=Cryobacterium sp. GrIS_2_6 TaxID=3162785 RepID=UPI002DF8E677|nr:hypothetical protein [Cryobacterium psychrotolerans]